MLVATTASEATRENSVLAADDVDWPKEVDSDVGALDATVETEDPISPDLRSGELFSDEDGRTNEGDAFFQAGGHRGKPRPEPWPRRVDEKSCLI